MKLNPEPGTPLPWHVFGRLVGGPDFVRVADTYASERSAEEQDANALYLVHAANLYPELVWYLGELVESCETIAHCDGFKLPECHIYAKAVLQRAERAA